MEKVGEKLEALSEVDDFVARYDHDQKQYALFQRVKLERSSIDLDTLDGRRDPLTGPGMNSWVTLSERSPRASRGT